MCWSSISRWTRSSGALQPRRGACSDAADECEIGRIPTCCSLAFARPKLRAQRGRLTIFFGANAGVGKTYAMLEAAQRRRAEGADVVVGYVELHGRSDTERLLVGLEQLPPLMIRFRRQHRVANSISMPLCARKPQLLLVDELAHTNVSGGDPPPRHEKRWQDVEELLDAGIDVYTTVNVQHLESLSDVVWQITGVRQLETFPDRVFDAADEIKLVDVTAG